MHTKLRLAAALPLALLLVLTGGATSNAQTSTSSPVVSGWDCDPGGSLMWCAVTVKGGTTPYTYKWYKDGVHKPQFTGHVLRLGCSPGSYVRIDVVVTDAIGQQVSAGAFCTCVRDWQ